MIRRVHCASEHTVEQLHLHGRVATPYQVKDQKDHCQPQEDVYASRNDVEGEPGNSPCGEQNKKQKDKNEVCEDSHKDLPGLANNLLPQPARLTEAIGLPTLG